MLGSCWPKLGLGGFLEAKIPPGILGFEAKDLGQLGLEKRLLGGQKRVELGVD